MNLAADLTPVATNDDKDTDGVDGANVGDDTFGFSAGAAGN